jgi:hypothetical protein
MRFHNRTLISIVALAICGPIQAAHATEIIATITGTVASGNDNSGVFGPANSKLAGDAFTLTFTFDDSKGVQNVGLDNGVPDFSSITSTAISNPGTATLTIGADSFTFGVINTAKGAYSEFARYAPPGADSQVFLVAGDGYYLGGSAIEGYVYPATGSVLTRDYDWEDSFSDSSLHNTASLSFEISEFGITNQFVTDGSLIPQTITVKGLNPTPVPEPASSSLSGICVLFLGVMLRRTQRRLPPMCVLLCAACFAFLSLAVVGNSQERATGNSVNQGVEWKSNDHALVHRADADVDINGKNAAVTFKSAVSAPFIFEFENSGVVGGIKRSFLRAGRSLTFNGGWKVSSSGRQVLNTANGGAVPGGNGGIVMRACKELLDAMGDAQADATKNGRAFKPVGKSALEDFVRARSF